MGRANTSDRLYSYDIIQVPIRQCGYWFGFPKILMSDQRSHFINHIIITMTEGFQIEHQNSTTYHPQANGIIKQFNKVLEHALTKACNTNRDDWYLKIPTIL